MKGTFLLFCFVACGLLNLNHPLSAEAVNPELDSVSVDFRVLAWKTNLPELSYSEKGEIEELESFSCSLPHHYTGPATLSFFSNKRTQRSPKMRSTQNALASITFPVEATRFTLLAIREGRQSYTFYAVPENGELLPSRFVLLHNFTDYNLRIDYNEGDRIQIPGKDTAYIQLNQGATVVHVSYEHDTKWRKLFNNVVELNDDYKANVIFTDSDERPVTMIAIPHWPSTPSPEDEL